MTDPLTLPSPEDGPILLFDGVCTLCNGTVHFILRRDPRGVIRFAPLQSPMGQALLARAGLPLSDFDTVVYLEGERVHTRSAAVLHVARHLRGAWPLASLFLLVPRPLRDRAYDLVARRRYRLFGREDRCMLPTPELRARVLDG